MEENKKIDKYLDLTRELKKVEKYESDGDNNCNWSPLIGSLKLGKKTGDQRKNRDPSDNSNIRID